MGQPERATRTPIDAGAGAGVQQTFREQVVHPPAFVALRSAGVVARATRRSSLSPAAGASILGYSKVEDNKDMIRDNKRVLCSTSNNAARVVFPPERPVPSGVMEATAAKLSSAAAPASSQGRPVCAAASPLSENAGSSSQQQPAAPVLSFFRGSPIASDHVVAPPVSKLDPRADHVVTTTFPGSKLDPRFDHVVTTTPGKLDPRAKGPPPGSWLRTPASSLTTPAASTTPASVVDAAPPTPKFAPRPTPSSCGFGGGDSDSDISCPDSDELVSSSEEEDEADRRALQGGGATKTSSRLPESQNPSSRTVTPSTGQPPVPSLRVVDQSLVLSRRGLDDVTEERSVVEPHLSPTGGGVGERVPSGLSSTADVLLKRLEEDIGGTTKPAASLSADRPPPATGKEVVVLSSKVGGGPTLLSCDHPGAKRPAEIAVKSTPESGLSCGPQTINPEATGTTEGEPSAALSPAGPPMEITAPSAAAPSAAAPSSAAGTAADGAEVPASGVVAASVAPALPPPPPGSVVVPMAHRPPERPKTLRQAFLAVQRTPAPLNAGVVLPKAVVLVPTGVVSPKAGPARPSAEDLSSTSLDKNPPVNVTAGAAAPPATAEKSTEIAKKPQPPPDEEDGGAARDVTVVLSLENSQKRKTLSLDTSFSVGDIYEQYVDNKHPGGEVQQIMNEDDDELLSSSRE